MKSYRFWRDGKNSSALEDRFNEKIFLNYIRSEVGTTQTKNLEQEISQLEKEQNTLESTGKYREALEIASKIKKIQQNLKLNKNCRRSI